MEEIWKPIKDYEGLYLVSNMGRVMNCRTGRILKDYYHKGYRRVDLFKNGKRKHWRVHRLVAMAFVDGYKEGLVVNHINEDKSCNVWFNLEWVTQGYNIRYSKQRRKIN